MFLHFVLTLYASSYWRDEGSFCMRRPRVLVFPHFVLTSCISLNRLSVSILAILYGRGVCPTTQTSPSRFFNSFFFSSFVESGIFDDCDLLQGCFTQANNYLRLGEHRESYSLTHSPSSLNQSTLPITLCQSI